MYLLRVKEQLRFSEPPEVKLIFDSQSEEFLNRLSEMFSSLANISAYLSLELFINDLSKTAITKPNRQLLDDVLTHFAAIYGDDSDDYSISSRFSAAAKRIKSEFELLFSQKLSHVQIEFIVSLVDSYYYQNILTDISICDYNLGDTPERRFLYISFPENTTNKTAGSLTQIGIEIPIWIPNENLTSYLINEG